MRKKVLVVVAVVTLAAGTVACVGQENIKTFLLACCGLPGPVCPGSPGCPVILADKR
jgi:hypothetical protein